MGREYEGYRETLELLMVLYPGRLELSIPEVGKAIGRGQTTVYNRYGHIIKHGRISLPALAREMCKPKEKRRKPCVSTPTRSKR